MYCSWWASRICLFLFEVSPKVRGQYLQRWGFSPVWIFRWSWYSVTKNDDDCLYDESLLTTKVVFSHHLNGLTLLGRKPFTTILAYERFGSVCCVMDYNVGFQSIALHANTALITGLKKSAFKQLKPILRIDQDFESMNRFIFLTTYVWTFFMWAFSLTS